MEDKPGNIRMSDNMVVTIIIFCSDFKTETGKKRSKLSIALEPSLCKQKMHIANKNQSTQSNCYHLSDCVILTKSSSLYRLLG